jgi:HEAT repeat protein
VINRLKLVVNVLMFTMILMTGCKNDAVETDRRKIQIDMSLINEILSKLERMNPQIGNGLAVGLNRNEIVTKLNIFPYSIPEEVYLIYQWKNGPISGIAQIPEILPGWTMLSLDQSIKLYKEFRELSEGFWEPQWLPLFESRVGGEMYVVRCGTGKKDEFPVYHVRIAGGIDHSIAFDSLETMIQTIFRCFETEVYELDSDDVLEIDHIKAAEIRAQLNPITVEVLLREAKSRDVIMLVSKLEDNDYEVREKALKALLELKNKTTVEPLIALLKSNDLVAREMALRALGEIRDVRAVDAITTALAHSNPEIRKLAIAALSKIGSDKSIHQLIKILNIPEDENRSIAAAYLGNLKATQAVDSLIKALTDNRPFVRGAAAESLGKLGNKRAIEPLIMLLRDGSIDVKCKALWSLGELGDSQSKNVISELLQKESNDLARRTAMASLEKIERNKSTSP